MMAPHKILTEAEIASALKPLKDWSVKGRNIEASFEFQTFRDAISFIVQIAIEAEVLNHHPEFFNSYNKVSFSFCTHDVGNKITDADIEIASRISKAAHRFLSMK
jgi:4a-hydroxytetrahydrobiopterin dehydratase